MKRKIILAGFVLMLLACSQRQPQMDSSHIINIANETAILNGFQLNEFELPRAQFQPAEKDMEWGVYYERKDRSPGFFVFVDDKTGESALYRDK